MEILKVVLASLVALGIQFANAAQPIVESSCPTAASKGMKSFEGFEFVASYFFTTPDYGLVSPEDLKQQFEDQGVLNCIYISQAGNRNHQLYKKKNTSKFIFEHNNTIMTVSYNYGHKPCQIKGPCLDEAGPTESATLLIKCNGNNDIQNCKFYIAPK